MLYIYFTIIVIFILSVLYSLFPYKFYKNFIVLLIILVSSFLPGLRDASVGTDTFNYVNMYNSNFGFNDWLRSGIEPGYICLMFLSSFIGGAYTSLFLLSAFLYNTIIIFSIRKLSINFTISILAYLTFSTLYFINFNILRQSIAVSLFIASYKYLIEGRYLKYSAFVFFATLFHYSAFFLLLLIPLRILLKKFYYGAVFISILIGPIFAFIIEKFIPFIATMLNKSSINSYSGNPGEAGLRGFLFVNFLIAILFFYLNHKNNLLEREKGNVYVMLLFLLVGFNFSITFLGLRYEGFGRIIVYFYSVLIFVFPYFSKFINKEYSLILNYIIVVLCLVYVYLLIGIYNMHQILPYVSVDFL